jgi:1,4-alpha-glucan branching enzyme
MSLIPTQSSGTTCFYYKSATAHRVTLVGDFNNWTGQNGAMTRLDKNVWKKCLDLSSRAYEYGFSIDGKVADLPDITRIVDDGFGGVNGYIIVE